MLHGHTKVFEVTPTVDTSAYADGDNIGGASYELPSVNNEGQGGVIWTINVFDYAKQTPAITILFFDQEPTNTTFTDNAVLAVDDADLPHLVGHVAIASTDYASLSDNAVATKTNIGLSYVALEDSLWAVIQSNGAPTFVADSDLDVQITIWMD